MKLMITGANGFVGRHLMRTLCAHSGRYEVIAVVRNEKEISSPKVKVRTVFDINGSTDWSQHLELCQYVVHLAARVHVMEETISNPLVEYRRVNVEGTLNLARQAAAAGVKRFIFISSTKVNGETTSGRAPFSIEDPRAPVEPYGISKSEAEIGLQLVGVQTGMQVVIIRPPLIYGPGVQGNFATMVKWIRTGLPLPLGAIHNQRSLVGVDNLVDLIETCLHNTAAANEIFHVSDDEDLSTTDLMRGLAQAMHFPERLLPLSQPLVENFLRFIGRGEWVSRLCGNLQVDISHTCRTLDWRPPISVAEGLRRAVREMDAASESL